MFRLIRITLICLCFFIFTLPARAIVDPLAVTNNRFGIHIIDSHDLKDAATLVNSSGGDWGYVTLVLRIDDLDKDKWQDNLDQMRRLHLIPLIRLATKPQGDTWEKPKTADVEQVVNFLNQLNWVVKNRYIIIFNEPNHALEWGGEIKPHEYVDIFKAYQKALKAASPDFFVLPAGFDAAAPNSKTTMSLSQYYKFMSAYDKEIFNLYDGYTAHAYANPDFSGSITDRGPMSLVSYRLELAAMRKQGLTKKLPIFLTETGWMHREGSGQPRNGTYTADRLAKLFSQAYTQVWTDPDLVAVTPFVLNYPQPPFDHFSWKIPGSETDFYPQYEAVKAIPKITGQPEQIDHATVSLEAFPPVLIRDSVYQIPLEVKNLGQTIWGQGQYHLVIEGDLLAQPVNYPLPKLEPMNSFWLTSIILTQSQEGTYPLNLRIEKNGQALGAIIEKSVTLIKPPSLVVKAQVMFKKMSSSNQYSLLIYDQDHLITKISPFTLNQGVGTISDVRNLIPGKAYRFVVTRDYYLPRQTIAPVLPQQTTITFEKLLPVDFFPDGQLTLRDLWEFIVSPKLVFKLVFAK